MANNWIRQNKILWVVIISPGRHNATHICWTQYKTLTFGFDLVFFQKLIYAPGHIHLANNWTVISNFLVVMCPTITTTGQCIIPKTNYLKKRKMSNSTRIFPLYYKRHAFDRIILVDQIMLMDIFRVSAHMHLWKL